MKFSQYYQSKMTEALDKKRGRNVARLLHDNSSETYQKV